MLIHYKYKSVPTQEVYYYVDFSMIGPDFLPERPLDVCCSATAANGIYATHLFQGSVADADCFYENENHHNGFSSTLLSKRFNVLRFLFNQICRTLFLCDLCVFWAQPHTFIKRLDPDSLVYHEAVPYSFTLNRSLQRRPTLQGTMSAAAWL